MSTGRVLLSTDHKQENLLEAVGNTEMFTSWPCPQLQSQLVTWSMCREWNLTGDAYGCLMCSPGGKCCRSWGQKCHQLWGGIVGVSWRNSLFQSVSGAAAIIQCPCFSMNYSWGYIWVGSGRISRNYIVTCCLPFLDCNYLGLLFLCLYSPVPHTAPEHAQLSLCPVGISNQYTSSWEYSL